MKEVQREKTEKMEEKRKVNFWWGDDGEPGEKKRSERKEREGEEERRRE